MIVKEKALSPTSDYKQKLGNKVENNVAFYLKRQFSEQSNVLIFHDLRFEHKGEAAQIDHLVVYKKGFIVIESKSIKGTVTVNEQLEWQRTVRGQWIGMPSPITQASIQAELLKNLLNDHADTLLVKILGLQGYFGGRCWDTLCAASNDAIIDRAHIPSKLSQQIVKAEGIPLRVKEIIAQHSNVLKPNPSFNSNELNNIKYFLLAEHKPLNNLDSEPEPLDSPEPEAVTPLTEEISTAHSTHFGVVCKQCSSSNTVPKYGKFGYYVNCTECNTNTSMKLPCRECGNKKTRVSKRKQVYTLSCSCGHETQFEYRG
ncbi:nuclease [Vibrio neptunius]|uniref:nuclease-related domain-containing protein n=1 Tax=Vibrio neptunius TaxID=170651 RepID=UPI0005F9CC7C|nr:nuclease-related domain-containing protein [Vibrio neptunius]KJY90544.1 nuclease [Vibrio neptunius]